MDTTSPLPLFDWHIYENDGQSLKSSDIVAGPVLRLLRRRGFVDVDDERALVEFLDSPLDLLVHPLALPGVEDAAHLIVDTIKSGGKIVVFGDFDCDGITATALLTKLLRFVGADVMPFIPKRSEGYGLTDGAVARCMGEADAMWPDATNRLLVTVDCGMGAGIALKKFLETGYRVIVSDHHTPGAPLPPECIEVATRRSGVPDPCRYLCGAGVAYHIACGVITTLYPLPDRAGRAELHEWMGPLAVATVADVVPLLGENRAYVREGLKVLNRRPGIGIMALLREAFASTPKSITAYHLGFVLGPNINASGRMDSAEPALRMLLSSTLDEATPFAKELKRLNAARQHDEKELLEQIEKQMSDESVFNHDRDGAAVFSGENWHPGVVGLAAGRLCSCLNRPVAVISVGQDGEARGSVRAPAVKYNVWDALNACSGCLLRFGGHESAAGFSLEASKIPQFRAAFAEACRAQAGAVSVKESLKIEGVLDADDISAELMESIKRLEPCGNGNETPLWVLLSVNVKALKIGDDKKHLRMNITREDDDLKISGIWFGGGSYAEIFERIEKWDVVGEISENEFRGNVTIQFIVRDARPSCQYGFLGEKCEG